MDVRLQQFANVWVVVKSNGDGTCTVIKNFDTLDCAKEYLYKKYYNIKQCKSCKSMNETSATYCDQCGTLFGNIGKTIKL